VLDSGAATGKAACFPKGSGYHTQSGRNKPRVYHSTGFTTAEVTELGARIEARGLSPRMRRWPPVIGLRNALTVTLTYLRRNRVQAEIAEHYGVAQPAISRAVSAIAPLLARALPGDVPTAGELGAAACCIVDGTLLPCWSGRAHPELCSGRRKTAGMNVQVACTITSNLADHAHRLPPPLATFPETISAIVALHFYATS